MPPRTRAKAKPQVSAQDVDVTETGDESTANNQQPDPDGDIEMGGALEMGGKAKATEKGGTSATASQHPDKTGKPSNTTAKGKTAPGASRAASRRKSALEKKFEPPYVLTNEKSPLGEANLRRMLLDGDAWDSLTADDKQEILALLPDNNILHRGTEDAQPDWFSLANEDRFRSDCTWYSENIRTGRYDEDWLTEAWIAHNMHRRGDFDDYLAKKFKDDWEIEDPGEPKSKRMRSEEKSDASSAAAASEAQADANKDHIESLDAILVQAREKSQDLERDRGFAMSPNGAMLSDLDKAIAASLKTAEEEATARGAKEKNDEPEGSESAKIIKHSQTKEAQVIEVIGPSEVVKQSRPKPTARVNTNGVLSSVTGMSGNDTAASGFGSTTGLGIMNPDITSKSGSANSDGL